ncbi:MAG TPA: tetratricopeptide repeat protein, partial [Planctomycetota bacterium]|nr:tetratricopeptide repeat protein [Planctomycetota bacterium]
MSVAEDDNGAVETNARAVLQAEADRRYRILAAAAKEEGGEFELSIVSGDPPRPSGSELLDAAIAFRRTAAARALARGDRKAAAGHRIEESRRCYSRAQYAEAEAALEAALGLFRDLGDRAGEARTLGRLGLFYRSRGDSARSREHQEKALALARELGDRAEEARALEGLGGLDNALGDHSKARERYEQSLAL